MRIFSLVLTAALLTGCPAPDTGDSSKVSGDDADGDGFTSDNDCNDDDASINPDATEACDGIDNNCDEQVDEAGATGGATFYADSDGDSYGNAADTETACSAPSGFVDNDDDCDDGDSGVNPSAIEVCDDQDNNCDGATDEGVATTYFRDADGDGYGNPGATDDACSAPSGYVGNGDDCDDGSNQIHPGAAEICDNVDNDCDGDTDDDDSGVTETLKYYEDSDGDLYGDTSSVANACDAPSGYTSSNGDCDDSDPFVNPAAPEVCNGDDDDCDTLVDADDDSVTDATTYYMDADLDSYGDPTTATPICGDAGSEYSMDWTDCDDGNPSINPSATEVCDSADNDCDTLVDDDDDSVTGQTTWYVDADGDGGGDSDMSMMSCLQPSGYVSNMDDPYEDGAFSAFSATGDLAEATDVAANAYGIFAVGFTSAGEPTVVSIDMSTGAATAIFTGYPLVQPSGITVSDDGSMLYVSDVACTTGSNGYNGSIFEISTSGGSAVDLGVSGVIDMPGDASYYDGNVYSTGLNGSGQACLFRGMATLTCGDPLVDPLALDVSPDGTMIYVVDPLAEDGQGAVLAFGIDGTFMDVLLTDLDVVFPGGIAVDGTGMKVFTTSIGDPGLLSIAADASSFEVLDTSALLGLPTGVAVSGEMAFVADADASSTADLFLFSY